MVFSSFSFLFLFLPSVLLLNALLSTKASNAFLFLVSLLFYYIGESTLVFLLIASITWNYIGGLLLHYNKSSTSRKVVLSLCITGNILALVFYKYLSFFIESFSLTNLFSQHDYSDIALPLGISFFTFQGISYVVDVYRNDTKAAFNPLKLGLFIALFPQLIAGPIVKYKEIVSFLGARKQSNQQAVAGSFKFIRGLAKKVIIANHMAIIADQTFASSMETMPSAIAWIGLLCYSLQIYFDFSGYSDMAIGLCQVLGFKIPENFNYPYKAKSIKEFWQRWHISLSTWFKQYLYIPLGGNRKNKFRTYLNLIFVFFITGLWHGANYNFIIWGMIHGIFMILERSFQGKTTAIPAFLKHGYTLFIVATAWVFFRTTNIDQALKYFSDLFKFSNEGSLLPLIYLDPYFIFIVSIAILFTLPTRQKIFDLVSNALNSKSKHLIKYTCYLAVFCYCVLQLTVENNQSFIYFKF